MESAISDRGNPHQDSNSRAFDQEKVKGATGPVKYADAKRATCDKAFWVNRYMVDLDGPENNLKNWIKASLPGTYKYVGQIKRAGKSVATMLEKTGQPYNITGKGIGNNCVICDEAFDLTTTRHI